MFKYLIRNILILYVAQHTIGTICLINKSANVRIVVLYISAQVFPSDDRCGTAYNNLFYIWKQPRQDSIRDAVVIFPRWCMGIEGAAGYINKVLILINN